MHRYPIRNNTLLQEAYEAGYYRALNEWPGRGGGGFVNASATNNFADGGGGGNPSEPIDGPVDYREGQHYNEQTKRWEWFNPITLRVEWWDGKEWVDGSPWNA